MSNKVVEKIRSIIRYLQQPQFAFGIASGYFRDCNQPTHILSNSHHLKFNITHHELLRKARLGKLLASSTDMLCCVIGALGTTAKDDMNIRITLRMYLSKEKSQDIGIISGVHTSVSTILLKPSLPTERKTWPLLAARQASIATPTLPSVEFLKPVGIDKAEVNSR